jgi:hypothetical protein
VWAFEVHSAAHGAHGAFDEYVHCQGLVSLAVSALPAVDLHAVYARMSPLAHAQEDARIEAVFGNGRELLVSLHGLLDSGRPEDVHAQRIDRLDAALRASAWLAREGTSALRDGACPDALQAAWDAAHGPAAAHWRWVWLRATPALAQSEGAMVLDIDLCDANGQVGLRLSGVTYDRLRWAPVAAAPAADASVAPAQSSSASQSASQSAAARPRVALAELE